LVATETVRAARPATDAAAVQMWYRFLIPPPLRVIDLRRCHAALRD
jgi:hypothetical protein